MIHTRFLCQQILQRTSRVLANSPAPCRHLSRSNGDSGGGGGSRLGSRLGQTSVFYQTGLKISELPLVVKKVNDVLNIQVGSAVADGTATSSDDRRKEEFLQSFEDFDNVETKEIISGLRRCFTVAGIFRLLETIPAGEVTPSVAVEALKLILTLETGSVAPTPSYRQSLAGVRRLTDAFQNGGGESTSGSETFLRHAFMNMLLDIVYRSHSPKVLIDCLEILCHSTAPDNNISSQEDTSPSDMLPPKNTSPVSDNYTSLLRTYKKKIYEEVLVMVTEGRFGLVQICDVIAVVSGYCADKSWRFTDRFWSGLVDKASGDELNAETMVHVISTVPHLKASRSVVLGLVSNRMGDFYADYTTKEILDMLRVITDSHLTVGKHFTRKVMPVVSSWILRHIHTLSEDQLLAVVVCYSKMAPYTDDEFNATLNKYIKVRGCYIEDANLVAAICDYCIDTRLRSEGILNGVSEYFVNHSRQLTTPQLHSIARLFGELDFHPANGFMFWELLEQALEVKFSEFPPKDMIGLMLSFVYIERYPLNFVRKMFNSSFLDRIHSQSTNQTDVRLAHYLLHLFDLAMKFDCPLYGGPYLPKKGSAHAFFLYGMSPGVGWTRVDAQDSLRMVNFLMQPMGEVVGDIKRIGTLVDIPQLPPYVKIDMMVYPSTTASFLKFGFSSENSKCVAVLIHTANHYDQSGDHLVGFQAMRVRHLKKMGFKVMHLKYNQLTRLRQNPTKLSQVLTEHYNKAS